MGASLECFFKNHDAEFLVFSALLLWGGVAALLYLVGKSIEFLTKRKKIKSDKWAKQIKSIKSTADIVGFLLVVGCAALVPIDIYVSHFGNRPMSTDPEQWGQMGDFFGGMLNPILAFASFIALLYTIRIQSEELKLTREEFAKSVKAQERMAGEAEQSRKQGVVLEDYQHVCTLLRSSIRALEDLLRKPLHLELLPSCDAGVLPVNVFAVIGNLMACFKQKGPESTECERLAEGLSYVESSIKATVRNYSVLQNSVFEFCELSYQLVDLHRMYVDLCEELDIQIEEGSVQDYDLAGVGRFIAFAYMLAVPFDLTNTAYSTKHKLHDRATTEFNNFLFTFGLTNRA